MKFLIIIFLLLQIVSTKFWLTAIEAQFIARTLMSDILHGIPSSEKFQKILVDPYFHDGKLVKIDEMVQYIKESRKKLLEVLKNQLYNDSIPNPGLEAGIEQNFQTRKAIVYYNIKDFAPDLFKTLFNSEDAKEYANWVKKHGSERLNIQIADERAMDRTIHNVDVDRDCFNFTFEYKLIGQTFSVGRIGKSVFLLSQKKIGS